MSVKLRYLESITALIFYIYVTEKPPTESKLDVRFFIYRGFEWHRYSE